MAATTFSRVIFNSREQVLSSDLNRLQTLASRELQDVLRNGCKGDSFTDSTPGNEGMPAGNNLAASDVDRADNLGGITGASDGFDVTMTAGQVFATIPAATTEESSYSVVRWPSGSTFTLSPDSSQVLIYLIYAAPNMFQEDTQSRNILTDPVARTVAPANVQKTSNPTVTTSGNLAYVMGNAGDTEPPAVPAGCVPLWEVITYNTDTSAAQYRFIPRIWKRVQSFGTCHAVLQNCKPLWPVGLESVSNEPYLDRELVHKAIIDGEVIVDASGLANIIVEPDTNGNPLTQTIATTFDRPVYLYLCGGRHAPQNGIATSRATASGAVGPLRLVASINGPGAGNRAGQSLGIKGVTIPRSATLYVGCGFIAKDTHNYKSCIIDGDWVYAITAPSGMYAGCLYEAPVTGASGTLNLLGSPSSSTMADLVLQVNDTAQSMVTIVVSNAVAYTNAFATLMARTVAANSVAFARGKSALSALWSYSYSGGYSTTTVTLSAAGFNMNVPRIG